MVSFYIENIDCINMSSMGTETAPISISKIGISIAIGIVTIWAWRVLNWLWFRPKKFEKYLRKQGLAGNPYRFFYGDSQESSEMTRQALSKPFDFDTEIGPRVIPFIHQILNNYGKNSFLWFGPTPRVIVMDPQLMKEIYNKIDDFRKTQKSPLAKLLATGLAVLEGPKWAKHRKIINPAFHLHKLKLMVPAFYESSREMIEKWEHLVRKEGSSDLDVQPYFQRLSSDAISRTAFGSNYQEGKRVFDLLEEQVEHTVRVINSIYIPGWRFLPTKRNKRMKEIDKEIRELLMGIINKREKATKGREVSNDDLLGLLVESNLREIEEHGNGMTFEEMMDECKIFYSAGQATTALLLVWTMIMLAKHQDWQEKAREEVFKVFGKNKPECEGLNHLKTMNMILHEVVRLYPAVPTPTRTVHRETNLGKLTLPAGVELIMPILIIHQDPEIWGDDALEFNPDRFNEGVSKATKNQTTAFYSFGWGPRFCIGQNFALIEAKVALVTVLQNFWFELSPSYTHSPAPVGPIKPQHGAPLILHKL